jgi:hypothetical protein
MALTAFGGHVPFCSVWNVEVLRGYLRSVPVCALFKDELSLLPAVRHQLADYAIKYDKRVEDSRKVLQALVIASGSSSFCVRVASPKLPDRSIGASVLTRDALR